MAANPAMLPEPQQQQPTPVQEFRAQLQRMQNQIKAALPPHVTIDKFVRTVVTAVQSNTSLLSVDRGSLMIACVEAASDGLLPDGREGAIVPYKGKANWQPMVWGLVKLVRQSGELATIGARIVRDGEAFEHWIDEDGEHFKHVPAYSSDVTDLSGMRLVYAYAKTKDGSLYFEAMGAAEIEKFRNLSKASSADSPWKTWPEEMAKVRPLKRLCKRLPLSTDVLDALERDAAREAAMMAAPTRVNPIEAMNQAIAGAPQAAPAAPALTHEPSPTLDQPATFAPPAAEPIEAEPTPPAAAAPQASASTAAADAEIIVTDTLAAIKAATSVQGVNDETLRANDLYDGGTLTEAQYKRVTEAANERIGALRKQARKAQ